MTTIRELAAEILTEANGDRIEGERLFRKRLDNDPELYTQIVEPLITQAIHDAMLTAAREVNATLRASVYGRVVEPMKPGQKTQPSASLARGSKVVAEGLLAFIMQSGKKLGDSTKEEITEDAKNRAKRGGTLIADAKWMLAIAERLKAGQIVRDALSASQVERIAVKFGKKS